jgi:uncharacterized damage-inducible protein DinB
MRIDAFALAYESREPMTQIPAWFERKFEFTFPVEQYSNLCVRLRGTPARLEELLRGSSTESLTKKPGGKWSAQEHAGHLLNLEPLWMVRVEDFLAGGDTLTAADLNNRKTDEANYNALPLTEILGAFRKARLALVDRAAELDPKSFSCSLLHPRLKQPMRLVDHLYFVAEHDDHHLATIWAFLNEP